MAEQKKKGGCSWLLWVIAIIILGNVFIYFDESGSGSRSPGESLSQSQHQTQSVTIAETQSRDHPSVPSGLQDHFILRQRDTGPCSVLEGNVGLIIVFVDDATSAWTTEEENAALDSILVDSQTISSAAAGWDVQLDFTLLPLRSSTTADVSFATASSAVPSIAEGLGLSSSEPLNDQLKEIYSSFDQMPVIFAFNKADRAFACPSWTNGEYCVMFNDVSGFFHELGHLYGAADYYIHEDVQNSAELYLGESFMKDACLTIDDLSAYLMGWTDELSSNALGFLEATASITDEDLSAAYSSNTYTGHTTREYDNGTYTGIMVSGAFEGYGVYTYNDGSSYSGFWQYGAFHGQGTFIWPDGGSYEGAFVNGQRTGWGTFTWPTGEVYTGEFLDGMLHGQGTMTYADGTVLSGTWDSNEFVG